MRSGDIVLGKTYAHQRSQYSQARKVVALEKRLHFEGQKQGVRVRFEEHDGRRRLWRRGKIHPDTSKPLPEDQGIVASRELVCSWKEWQERQKQEEEEAARKEREIARRREKLSYAMGVLEPLVPEELRDEVSHAGRLSLSAEAAEALAKAVEGLQRKAWDLPGKSAL